MPSFCEYISPRDYDRTSQHEFSRAYEKWKAVGKRHVHELSLMESYQDVKRAGKYFYDTVSIPRDPNSSSENMRKVFVRWLTAARKARHRRLQLQEKEEEFKLMTIASAFDKWRERYMEIRLQPLVRPFHPEIRAPL